MLFDQAEFSAPAYQFNNTIQNINQIWKWITVETNLLSATIWNYFFYKKEFGKKNMSINHEQKCEICMTRNIIFLKNGLIK